MLVEIQPAFSIFESYLVGLSFNFPIKRIQCFPKDAEFCPGQVDKEWQEDRWIVVVGKEQADNGADNGEDDGDPRHDKQCNFEEPEQFFWSVLDIEMRAGLVSARHE